MVATVVVPVLALTALAGSARAEATAVDLGTAASYSVLGGQAVTNTGPSVLFSDLGVSPGTAITGFPPGLVGGALHANDAHAAQAQADLTIGYDNAAGQASDASVSGDLVGLTLLPGVYTSADSLAVSGALVLDGEGDVDSVFVFQVASTLTTASASEILLINGAQACNVFWQVGSSATLGTESTFVGTVMALTSVTVTTGSVVEGRALARNGAVTLDNVVFLDAGCDTGEPPTSGETSATDTGSTETIGTTGGSETISPSLSTPSEPGTSAAETTGPATSAEVSTESPPSSASTTPGTTTTPAVPVRPGTPSWQPPLAETGAGIPTAVALTSALVLVAGGSGLLYLARRRRG